MERSWTKKFVLKTARCSKKDLFSTFRPIPLLRCLPCLVSHYNKKSLQTFPNFSKAGLENWIQSPHTINSSNNIVRQRKSRLLYRLNPLLIAEHMCLHTYCTFLRPFIFLYYCQTVFLEQLFLNNSAILFLKSPPKETANIYFGGYSILLSQLRR